MRQSPNTWYIGSVLVKRCACETNFALATDSKAYIPDFHAKYISKYKSNRHDDTIVIMCIIYKNKKSTCTETVSQIRIHPPRKQFLLY